MRVMRYTCLMLGLLLARPGQASPVFPFTSTVPTAMQIVGSSASGADPAGRFTVIGRELAGNPHPNVDIVLDFSQCPDFILSVDQRDPDVIVNCAARTLTKISDVNGAASFAVIGRSRSGAVPALTVPRVRVLGTGVLLGTPVVASFDLDGAAGVGINDLAVWLDDFGTGVLLGRSDFDHDGAVGINDLAIWIGVFGTGSSAAGGAPECP